ncbi:dynactin subunit 6 isoform X3 [Malaclemys terrapin pileata]|uniref:dynactin subunit 6 isoform X3 n=1 Tax=Malaclemys terrapin pileata TaxID=2991368 RepID=UPI0023A8AB94|nr:dynactin subunit 6 isoform X3 [Malaclemys terrapin pileata]
MFPMSFGNISRVKIAPGAVVCVESEIRGDVTIGPRTVIHPKARIIAEAGPIVIGEGNLIEEQTLIINGYPENISPDMEEVEAKPMVIGTYNVFEVGCSWELGRRTSRKTNMCTGRNLLSSAALKDLETICVQSEEGDSCGLNLKLKFTSNENGR